MEQKQSVKYWSEDIDIPDIPVHRFLEDSAKKFPS